MSDAKGQHEPSMEEILASIRRIIAEDNDAPVTADDPPAQDAKPAAPAAALGPATVAAEPAAASAPVATAAKEDDVLELTEVVEEEPPVTPATPEPVILENHPEEPVMSVEADLPETQAAQSAAERDRLLSNTTAAASVAALSQLVVRPRDKSGELPLGAADRTLEDMVRELIRPMLKDWLDEHLPTTVERIVKDEVGRLVREAQGS